MLHEFPYPGSTDPLRISLRDDGITLAIDDTFSFDREGRLLTAALEGKFYKRGLNGRILQKQRLGPDRRERLRRILADDEKDWLYGRASEFVQSIRELLGSRADQAISARIDELMQWDPMRYASEAMQYDRTYRRVGILPPDQYMSLVLQATEGCHYNGCTFCSFYHGIPFRAKNAPEFTSHIDDVLALVGRGVRLRRTVFLADANALVLSQARLIPLFEALNQKLLVEPADLDPAGQKAWRHAHPEGITGVYSFIDAFTGTRKTAADFEELRRMGLRRVYIGMESGHVPLLDFIRKPSVPEEVRAVVNAAHQAGVRVGIILMLGIGGHQYSRGHVADSAAVVNSLGLRQGDILYFSEYVGEAGSDYDTLAAEAGISPMTVSEIMAQGETLNRAIEVPPTVKRAVYDIREFVY